MAIDGYVCVCNIRLINAEKVIKYNPDPMTIKLASDQVKELQLVNSVKFDYARSKIMELVLDMYWYWRV